MTPKLPFPMFETSLYFSISETSKYPLMCELVATPDLLGAAMMSVLMLLLFAIGVSDLVFLHPKGLLTIFDGRFEQYRPAGSFSSIDADGLCLCPALQCVNSVL